jgi:predicted ArsR family transcriptional regulator
MQPLDFERTIGDLAASLGDPTRRGIYITARQSAGPVTAGEIARAFGIHPNVARHHLDRLVEDGYLEVVPRDAEGRPGGAGRPAKGYAPTDKEILVSYPARRYDLLAELLVRVLERVAPDDAADAAEQVGREYGRELAAQVGMPEEEGFADAVRAVISAMAGVGFDISADDEQRLLTSHCPFGTAAANHPEVVCRIDQGIVRGLLDAAGAAPKPVTVSPHSDADEACVTEVAGGGAAAG